jgi:hypothetical protein
MTWIKFNFHAKTSEKPERRLKIKVIEKRTAAKKNNVRRKPKKF